MDNSTIKQVAQNILDTSYKLYSDVSLINSSLFRAASTLGVELPEIPQISLAATKEKITSETLKQASSAMEKLSEGKKVPLFGVSKKRGTQESEEEKQAILQPVIDIKEKDKNKVENEQKINKMANELVKGPNYKPGNIEVEEKPMVAQPAKKQETKISLQERETELNKLQVGKPTNIKVEEKTETENISPFEAVSLEKQANPQSELQKKIFETTNFGKLNGGKTEEVDEILNNPLSRLLTLVKEKHSVTSSQAAQALNVSKELVDKWAKILSQNSLIRIRYQLMGDTIFEA